MENLKQILPQELCLNCEVCCRFPAKVSPLTPFFCEDEVRKTKELGASFLSLPHLGKLRGLKINLSRYKDNYACPFFSPENNRCSIYETRPFDCRLYPFILTYNQEYNRAILVADPKCPFISENLRDESTKEYVKYLIDFLKSDKVVEKISYNFGLIGEYQEDTLKLAELNSLSKNICKIDSNLRRLSLKDKALFEEYLRGPRVNHLSAYSFVNIFIWSDILNILWRVIDDNLCVFAGQDDIFFLLLPPLGLVKSEKAVLESLKILDSLNKGGTASRIENIHEEDLEFFSRLGLKIRQKAEEYICLKEDLVSLKGNKYKDKRATYNYFVKNYRFKFRPFELEDMDTCLDLYFKWSRMRMGAVRDNYFAALIEDSLFAQRRAMMYYQELGLLGKTVEIDPALARKGGVEERLVGYTFGYPLNEDTSCVLFEITDLTKKGLSSFIFREFSRELKEYKYINLMDDSGLLNLRKVKLSYHPSIIQTIYTAEPS